MSFRFITNSMVTELDAAATQQFSQLAADAAKTSREALDSTAEVIKKFQNLGDREVSFLVLFLLHSKRAVLLKTGHLTRSSLFPTF